MDKSTMGIAVILVGLVAFIESFKLVSTEKIVYLLVGVALILGGLYYATRKK